MRDPNVTVAYADWNPHFTPKWLSERLVATIPRDYTGTILDPSCGGGNLLIAAATHLNLRRRHGQSVRLRGVDVSERAVKACRAALRPLIPSKGCRIDQGDFLTYDGRFATPLTVLMNPPFKGYGKLDPELRRRLATSLEMGGRFNLAYAFVLHAINSFSPDRLIALLPSNWMKSRASSFARDLDELGGTWTWTNVGGRAFTGVNVHVGILKWESEPSSKTRRRSTPKRKPGRRHNTALLVRHGVATGADSLFTKIASNPPRGGVLKVGTRGRDVGKATGASIWVPSGGANVNEQEFAGLIGRESARVLRARHCVRVGKRKIFEYHETPPEWFLKGPKLLIPEIVSSGLRVSLDKDGARLPLHSTIAIRVSSIVEGRAVKRYLSNPEVSRRILAGAPRLSGRARRTQISAIRSALGRWLDTVSK